MTTCDLGIVLEITGGLSATALAYLVSIPDFAAHAVYYPRSFTHLLFFTVPSDGLFQTHQRSLVFSTETPRITVYGIRSDRHVFILTTGHTETCHGRCAQ